ncbi:chorismate mutase [Nanoarchaeota archaeon]
MAPDEDKIKEVRKHIDRIDAVIINALAERMSVMPEIGEYKKANKIPITQEEREIQIMEKLLTTAEEHGLDRSFVEEVFLSVFNEAKRIQKDIIDK